ncbi:MAG: MauE/DoxX family redox-associated membrane protein [Ignavibacteriaceae bacterium]
MKTDFTITGSYTLTKEKLKQNLYVISFYFIAVVLLVSGISKILNPENLLNTLNATLTFLGENILILIATVLPVLEIALGLMLILPVPMGKIKTKETLIATLILFAVFFLFSIYGTIAGYDVDCGCFGTVIKNEFGVWMIFRNMILFVITFLNFKYYKGHLNFES